MEKNTFNRTLCEFLSLLVNSVLHAAHVYPEQYFVRQATYEITSWVTSVDALEQYINDHIWWVLQKHASWKVRELVVSIRDLEEGPIKNGEPSRANETGDIQVQDSPSVPTSNQSACALELARLRVFLPDSEALESVLDSEYASKLHEAYKARFRLLLCRVQTYPWPPAPNNHSIETWKRTFRLYFRVTKTESRDSHELLLYESLFLQSSGRTNSVSAPCAMRDGIVEPEDEPGLDLKPLASVVVPLCDDFTVAVERPWMRSEQLSLFACIEELS
ncbi:hypothetical protein CCYA_CCYA17G4338 [Cyanidiococcus yangmingshanensis]|nr:hypothetical protein CCYA_CCYA17G4338 [Cyanidiococcus yangmingshanensis]